MQCDVPTAALLAGRLLTGLKQCCCAVSLGRSSFKLAHDEIVLLSLPTCTCSFPSSGVQPSLALLMRAMEDVAANAGNAAGPVQLAVAQVRK